MENSIKTLLLLSFSLFIACKKDEESPIAPKDQTWALTAMSSEDGAFYYEDVDTSYYFYEHFTSVGKDFDATVTFGVDGSFKKSGTFKEVVTAIKNGAETTSETSPYPWLQNGQYELKDNVLTIESDFKKTVAEIISLTSHEMKLKVVVNDRDQNITDVFGPNPAPDPMGYIVWKGNYFYTLKKIRTPAQSVVVSVRPSQSNSGLVSKNGAGHF
jgi:hypothetical protein